MIGQSIGRYHVTEKLGEGGMATVYRAFDTRLDREVALKVIQPLRRESPEFLKRFEREAKALAQLAHPNIVSIHDYGEHDGVPYLVMEYTPGGTLKQRLGGPMPWPQACRLLAPIARALHYAHQQKIVHRDIKPSNILITASGDPKLSDFGIAKILEMEKTWDLTGTGVGIGTPEYMAPEQGMGKAVDHRADIYALGIVFFEMVTGRTPFKADTPLAVLLKQVNDPLPRPRELVAGLPKAAERIIFKALAKDPADRFQSMGDLAAALESLLRDAKSADIPTQIRPRGRLRRLGAIAGGAALLILLAAGARWAMRSYQPPADRSASSPSNLEGGVEPVAGGVTPMGTVLPATLSSADAPVAAEEIDLVLYDDFDTPGPVHPLLWGSETDFRVEDGTAVLQASKGDTASYRANLQSTGTWLPSASGAVRFSIETRIRVDPSVFDAPGRGSAAFQVTGPNVGAGAWWLFELGYVVESGFFAYECAGAFWDPSEPPPPYYSRTFGTAILGEWHTFRASLEESAIQGQLTYVGYVDGEAGCNWTPPVEWQSAMNRGQGLSFFLGTNWSGEWFLDQPFRAYYDDVRVGTGTDK